MKMRKLFAGIAAAATLFGGLALGATTANAVETPQLPYQPLAAGQVDNQGKVTADATFKFTADDADQWGINNNRKIEAYKLADYYQYVDVDGNAVFGVQTADAAKDGVSKALKVALADVTADANDPYAGKVPTNADTLAWALQYGYLDQSANKPWTTTDGSNPTTASTTRKFADTLNSNLNDETAPVALGDPTELSYVHGQGNLKAVANDPKSFTADLPAGIYLFLDVTSYPSGHIKDGTENDAATNGKVVVNSAPIILASGHLTADGTTNPVNYLYPLGDLDAGDNTVAFKNHVTPINKTVDDSDKTVSTGQTVRYTLKSTLPLTTGYDPTTYVYKLTDYPGAGQTVYLDGIKDANGHTVANSEDGSDNAAAYDVKVYDTNADGSLKDEDPNTDGVQPLKTLAAGTDFDLTTTSTDDAATAGVDESKIIAGVTDKTTNFTLDFSKLIQSADYNKTPLWGKTVVVTYVAKITGVQGDVPNTVEVNDNNTKAEHGTKLTLGRFMFTKTDAQGLSNADINGATFYIEPDASVTGNKAVALNNPDWSNQALVAKYDKNNDGQASDEEINHVADPWTGAGINESDSRDYKRQNGIVTFSGLADGTYTVTETKAPAGYLGDAISVQFNVTIEGGKAVSFKGIDKWGLAPTVNETQDAQGNKVEITDYKVKNVKNITELPKTGAAGIIMFTVIGALLAGAAGLVFTKSRATKRALRHV
ncbi:SpaA isopeptide-forming pilin-related protein [Bifidobacterium olomucense]|uniref:Uncharacterized protein n=1 Tax=Bifidobacterium olomucense TaxID=2675324 RepID=A0A7Y0EY59_9BIFI|nr:SpaA isopeptide-forming pilin-related protein [Bifidobacterium sp. DSM 109959]NMM98571.1 hypothetical protein [Bifidobacterium sp. DSM 109959]